MDITAQKMLADAINDLSKKSVAPYSTTATVKSVSEDGTIFVNIKGSDINTPVKASTVSVEPGDVVDIEVSHSDTHIIGNRSNVAASVGSVEKVASAMEATRLEMENELDIVGNTIKMYNNKINMQNNTIEMQNNTITQIGNTVNQQNNIIEQQSNTITQIGNTVSQMDNTITQQGNEITQMDNVIKQQDNKITQIGNTVDQQNSTIETIDSAVKTQGSAIETIGSDVAVHESSIQILNSAFVIQNGKLTGISEIITEILKSDYVTTDLLNAEVAWIEDGKIKQGAIGTVEIADQSVTTAKIKELSADVIKAGTLKTECLILTTDEVDPETGEKKVALITALNTKAHAGEGNVLDGAIIADETITAAKITVVDLNAFGATIGNFEIGTSSISNGKKSLTDPTNGVYIGTDGIALGQGGLLGMTDDSPFRIEADGDFHLGGKDSNYVNFDPFSGELDINVNSLKIGSQDVNGRITKLEQDSEGFNWSIDENAVVATQYRYYLSDSPTELVGSSWTTQQPTWTEGKYVWMMVRTTNGKGENKYSSAVCISGNTGEQGPQGETGATGADGKGIKSTAVTYQIGANGTTAPTGTWSSTPPKTTADKPYLWTRIIVTYTDNTTTTSYAVGSTPEGIDVGGTNMLSDTNVPSMTKKAGPANKYLSDTGNSSYATGSFVAITDPPIKGITHAYQHDCTTASSTSSAGRSLCFYQDVSTPMIEGEQYTLSMYARKISGTGEIRFMIGVSSYVGYNDTFEVTSEWKRYSHTFTYTDASTGGTGGARCYFGANCTVVGVVQTCGYKLERGNKATDWCLSDADIKYAADEAAKTATNYMQFQNNGLTVGNMTASTLGRNVLIDQDSVDIRNGSTVLASYGETITLKQDGRDAFTIKPSTILASVKNAKHYFEATSETVSGTYITGTISGTLSKNTIYIWHIKKNDKYVLFSPTANVSMSKIMIDESTPAFITVTDSSGGLRHYPSAYCDNNMLVDMTLKGSIIIDNNSDINGNVAGSPPLSIGAASGEHLELDNNEVSAKTTASSVANLYLNMEGGPVSINNNAKGLKVDDGAMYARYRYSESPPEYTSWYELLRFVNDTNQSRMRLGYGLYNTMPGPTEIYGNSINLYSKGDVVANTSFQVPNGSAFVGTNSSGSLRNNLQPCNTNNNCVIGYGSYSNEEGQTNIYSHGVMNFNCNSQIKSTRSLKELWSGADWMANTSTIPLSEKVSDQLNGIVLVWSYYTSAEGAQDHNFQYRFIPKSHVATLNGKGVAISLSTNAYASFKYLYISNASITGAVGNNTTVSDKDTNGLVMHNERFVLRYVYGV